MTHILTPEQRQVLEHMDRRRVETLIYWVANDYPVHVTKEDLHQSKPLAEIFAIKYALAEAGDLSQLDDRRA